MATIDEYIAEPNIGGLAGTVSGKTASSACPLATMIGRSIVWQKASRTTGSRTDRKFASLAPFWSLQPDANAPIARSAVGKAAARAPLIMVFEFE